MRKSLSLFGRQPAGWITLRGAVAFGLAFLFLISVSAQAANVCVTTWNLEWFPNGTPNELPPAEQAKRIEAAAVALRPLNSDIILLQEVRDYDTCARLAEAIRPHTYQVAICSAFKEPFTSGFGKQQVAILAKVPAQAAWSEPWKSMDGVDPPRGFAFAWFKIAGADIGVYSLHLKSNLIIRGNHEVEAAKNIRKREVAITQVLNHVRDVISTSLPAVKSVVVGGDFNTNLDQPDFRDEKTLLKFAEAGFRNVMEGMSQLQRVTHPGSGRYPDATFDYLFASHMSAARPQIVPSKASDHYPVTCDFTIQGTAAPQVAQLPQSAPAPVTAPQVSKLPQSAPAPAAPQFVRITEPVKIKIPYGETVLPRGLTLALISRDAQTVTVQYLNGTQRIPITSTDLH
jgi:endonuclease/exonuclease/phosphatase family metal-dependent hydrolase